MTKVLIASMAIFQRKTIVLPVQSNSPVTIHMEFLQVLKEEYWRGIIILEQSHEMGISLFMWWWSSESGGVAWIKKIITTIKRLVQSWKEGQKKLLYQIDKRVPLPGGNKRGQETMLFLRERQGTLLCTTLTREKGDLVYKVIISLQLKKKS